MKDPKYTPLLTAEELEQLQAEVLEVLEHLEGIDYKDFARTAEIIGASKYKLNKLMGTIESYK